MQKKFLLQILILGLASMLLAGCTAEYDVIIHNGNRVDEKIKLIIPNKVLEGNESIKDYLNSQIKAYKDIEVYSKYKFNKNIHKKNSYVNVKREYKSLKDYSESPFLSTYFQNITVIENKYYNIFQTVGDYYYESLYGRELSDKKAMQNVIVNIQLENKVLESNADEIDEKNNIYTWEFSPEYNTKSIYIKYSNEKRYDVIIKLFIMNHIIPIILVSLLTIIILLALIIFKIKFSSANKI